MIVFGEGVVEMFWTGGEGGLDEGVGGWGEGEGVGEVGS